MTGAADACLQADNRKLGYLQMKIMAREIGTFLIASKNLRRKCFRSIAIAGSIAIIAATLFSITVVIRSVETGLNRGSARLGADIMVVPEDAEILAKRSFLFGLASTFYMDRDIENKVRTVKGVKKTATQVFLKTARFSCCSVPDVLIIGFDPSNDFTVMPWLIDDLSSPLEDNEVIIGMGLIEIAIAGIKSEDSLSSVSLYGKEFFIASLLETTGIRFIDESIFMTYGGIRKIAMGPERDDVKRVNLPLDRISTVLVQVDPGIDPSRVALFIERDIPGVKAIVPALIVSSVRKEMFVILKSIIAVSLFLWIMTLLLIGVVISMAVNERKREFGVLRAIGAKKVDIFKILMTEVTLLSVIGGIAGVIAGNIFIHYYNEPIRSSLKFPYLLPTLHDLVIIAGMAFLFSFITGIGGAFLPVLRAVLLDPYASIRRGD